MKGLWCQAELSAQGRKVKKGAPVGFPIPLAHAGKDAGGSWHVQPHGKSLCRKQALQATAAQSVIQQHRLSIAQLTGLTDVNCDEVL